MVNVESQDREWRGEVVSVRMQAPDGTFSVFSVAPADGNGDAQTVRFPGAAPKPGASIIIKGRLVRHAKYGPQIEASSVTPDVHSRDGLLAYLSSGSIKGIGPTLAQAIVDNGGAALFAYPGKMAKLPRVSAKMAEQFCRDWKEQTGMREALVALQGMGLGARRAAAVVALYKGETITKVKTNPYAALMSVRGIGFTLADQAALASGVAPDAPMRIDAAIQAACAETMDRHGHTLITEDALVTAASALTQQPAEAISARTKRPGKLVSLQRGGQTLYSTKELHGAEQGIARDVFRLQKAEPSFKPKILPRHAMTAFEQATKMSLNADQRRAVQMAVDNKVMILTGGPGVGKTTTLFAILDLFRGARIKLCAPSARAAKRMQEATGAEAQTIHRTLGVTGGGFDGGFQFEHGPTNRLSADLVVVDESSMNDAVIAAKLFAALPDRCRLILVGDPDQLPSVAPGNVFADLIRSSIVPVARLTEVHRQAKGSQIAVQAARINKGQPLDNTEFRRDFFPIDLGKKDRSAPDGAIAATAAIVEAVTRRLPLMGFDPLRDVQILTPLHKGPCGTQALNAALQAALNPGGRALQLGEKIWKVGDKVCQTVNNSDLGVFNGDIGTITDVTSKDVTVSFPDGRTARYASAEDMAGLMLGYAITVHKSQGSEFPVIVMPVLRSHTIMLDQQILYTGVTRGKKMVVLLYEPEALSRAIATRSGRRRETALPFLLDPDAMTAREERGLEKAGQALEAIRKNLESPSGNLAGMPG